MTDTTASRDSGGWYLIDGGDEPEPAYFDGEGWALAGGGELTEPPIVMNEAPLTFLRSPGS